MSRVGKYPVPLPQGVTAEVKGHTIAVKGKMGNLSLVTPQEVEVKMVDGKVAVSMRHDTLRARALWGTNSVGLCVAREIASATEPCNQRATPWRASVASTIRSAACRSTK